MLIHLEEDERETQGHRRGWSSTARERISTQNNTIMLAQPIETNYTNLGVGRESSKCEPAGVSSQTVNLTFKIALLTSHGRVCATGKQAYTGRALNRRLKSDLIDQKLEVQYKARDSAALSCLRMMQCAGPTIPDPSFLSRVPILRCLRRFRN
ncbi:hypothetical protein EVAR_23372_1 [Eumeta japonica]|uniref:Uncharacterized protein n=1 Tax=Eumeta variegata TaxID=151549 RepID=A0A4C1VXT5_EUMVA|nr:hypothetical protein EVAR_23372_1 [Eumeta japonica]